MCVCMIVCVFLCNGDTDYLWVVSNEGALRYKPECRGFDSRPHYGPGVDSTANRNEYQECFLGVKAAGA